MDDESTKQIDRKLVQAAVGGDTVAWQHIWSLHEDRLRRMIRSRIDPRLHRRVGESDVLQEVFAAAARGLEEYRDEKDIPLYFWLRGIARNKLLEVHRQHLATAMRDPAREVYSAGADVSSMNLAEMLAAKESRPSGRIQRDEQKKELVDALERLDAIDREILALRHFEQMSNAETASVLGIEESAASKRYSRALQRLASLITKAS